MPQYFNKTYQDSRQQFLKRIAIIQNIFPESQHESYTIPPENTEELYTDILYIPVENTDKLILITSGVHGIEGFTGSAIQQMLIDDFIANFKIKHKTSYLFVHSINPFGHKYYRRVNENNVDLNRNFVSSEDIFSRSKNNSSDSYNQMNHFLNPNIDYESKVFEKFRFILKSLKIIKNNGIKTFRQAILQGQYEFEKGIFFGGKSYQPQKKTIDTIIQNYFGNYDEIVLIDIHTGYGYRGELHLIGMDSYPDKGVYEALSKLYPNDKIEQADKNQGDFYRIEGALFEYIYNKSKKMGKMVLPIAWEFGTNDNIKTLKSIESLRIIIQENQSFHYGTAKPSDTQKVKDAFRNLFYPDSKIWQEKVLKKASDTFNLLIEEI